MTPAKSPRGELTPPGPPMSPSRLAQRVSKAEGRDGDAAAGAGEEAASPGAPGSAGSHRPAAHCPGIAITRWAHSGTAWISKAR